MRGTLVSALRLLVGVSRVAVALGSIGGIALAVNTAVNMRRIRVPPADPPETNERVAVLVPARDEAERIEPCLRALLGQRGVAGLEILVLDDRSTDGTSDVVRRIAGNDPRVRVVAGKPLPAGWQGRSHACAQLAHAAASASVYVFADADVVLAPHAVAAMVAVLRRHQLGMVCPMPRQLADGFALRLVQPLVHWWWPTTMPARLAERLAHPAAAFVNGVFAADAVAYRHHGGHAAVAGEILEDVELSRKFVREGSRSWVVEGADIASCRMYESWTQARPGYAKSLWRVWRTPTMSAVVIAGFGLVYVLPPLAAVFGSRMGLAGYAAAVAGRAMIARRAGERVWPDSLAHPLSIVVWSWLVVNSWRRQKDGTLSWKDRPVG